jgi:hypothetical protein
MAKKIWRFEAALFLGLWLLWVGAAPAKFFRDPGTFWHTALGRQMLDTGELPRTETFTFTVRGRPWVSQFWLCQIVMAGLYRLGGWDSLLLATATVLAVIFAWLGGRLRQAGLAGIYSVLFVAVGMAASTQSFHVRPSVLTIVLIGPVFAWLVDVESGRKPLRRLAWLVPLFVLWTNVHGGVLGGLGTLVLVAVGWMIGRLAGRPSPIGSRREGFELAGIVAACGLTILVNPYGLELPRLWLAILRLPLSELIQEHGPLRVTEGTFIMTAMLAAVYLTALLTTRLGVLRITWLMPLVWLVLAMQRGRHAPLFAVITLLALADVLPHSGVARFLAWRGFFQAGEAERGQRLGWRRAVLPAGVLAVGLLLQAASLPAPLLGRGWVQLDPTYWPVAMLPELEQLEDSAPGEVRIYNDMLYGGFLIFHTPRLPIFVDDRCELYGERFLRRLFHVTYEEPSDLARWEAEFRLSHALVPSGTRVDSYLADHPRWHVLRRTSAATLYRRQEFEEPRRSSSP